MQNNKKGKLNKSLNKKFSFKVQYYYYRDFLEGELLKIQCFKEKKKD